MRATFFSKLRTALWAFSSKLSRAIFLFLDLLDVHRDNGVFLFIRALQDSPDVIRGQYDRLLESLYPEDQPLAVPRTPGFHFCSLLPFNLVQFLLFHFVLGFVSLLK